jgi:BirA family biotin operon repressor/biotin-[acetyl-CoA-carboxylase] ligase
LSASPSPTFLSIPALGRPRLHLRCTDSTNARARSLAIAGAPHGTLVTAYAQTAGRGRQGRSWTAPAGSSLLMSLVLRRDQPGHGDAAGEQWHALLPLAAAVAVCDVVGGEARIKWPNDVVFEGACRTAADGAPALSKLAGILVEGRPQAGWAVLGIGLNAAVRLDDLPSELRARAATLGLDGSEIEPLLAGLLDALSRRLGESPAAILAAWSARDALRGRSVRWAEGEGRAEGVDDQGRLLVALAGGGRVALGAGEVHLSGPG